MTGRRRAALLDRDGVINIDVGYLHRIEDIGYPPGTFEALRRIQDCGFDLIVVTNQSGIGRGYYEPSDFDRITAAIGADMKTAGVNLLATYHCPHHPDAACDCRKPQPGMILQAAQDYDLDLSASVLIGDKPGDIAAANAAGVGHAIRIASVGVPRGGADARVPSLCAAADWIEGNLTPAG